MQLRPYQQEAVEAIRSKWGEWRKELLVLPTGCGKTVVFNTIANQQPGKTLILAHREELIEQARDKYTRMFGEETGKIKAQERTVKRVTVGSIQTMSRNDDYAGMFDTIIVDEAHHVLSDSYQKFMQQFPNAKVLGVTATPDRGDKQNLAKFFDGIAYEYSLRQAVMDGYLVPIKARTVPLEIDMSNVKVVAGDYSVESIGASLEPYLPMLADAIRQHARDRKTVVFCPLISIAQDLCELIPGAREVNGTSADRKETLEWFDKAGKGSVLCNAMLLTEGWDCPSCDCVVVLRPTKIRSLYCQMVGRGTRLSEGKEDLLLLDFLWMTQRHNLCRPACLATDNDEYVKAVVNRAKSEAVELFGAVSDAEEATRQRLANELARKKKKLMTASDVFIVVGSQGMAEYQEVFQWEMERASDKQISTLKSFGIDTEGMTKGRAHKLLSILIPRRKEGKATPKQVAALKRHGYDAVNWSKEQASRELERLSKNGWRKH